MVAAPFPPTERQASDHRGGPTPGPPEKAYTVPSPLCGTAVEPALVKAVLHGGDALCTTTEKNAPMSRIASARASSSRSTWVTEIPATPPP
ncbi:hypothetical protein B1H20_09130 [Streptomyces violaceoruber]|uniref:Uncharacterized protein n=1 Tax=Streptomyces violaceoruber TaxID=1935 RepID=A0A1V0U8K3_STRVN|nr:hypothetical protein B1H20_09130 [Streptomyces violaceoruber]